MSKAFKILGGAAIGLVAGAISASAAVIDFTDNSTGLSGSEGGGWVLTGWNSPPLTDPVADAFCAADSGGTLACQNDGIGIGNDEISQTVNGKTQYATISFGKNVKITGFTVLNTYTSAVDQDFEIAYLVKGIVPSTPSGLVYTFDAEAIATQVNSGAARQSGFASSGLTAITGNAFTFFSSFGNDNAGQPDISLASIEISSVPLPATGLLLMGALGGLGLARRKKKT